ncbi:MAG: exodeoxyribonuclease III [Planctomycetaceae bacterium]
MPQIAQVPVWAVLKAKIDVKITTWNVNGLRAAGRKGFLSCLERIQPDVLLLQEVRALPEQLPTELAEPDGWHVVWNAARKKGYSGTAIWSRFPMEDFSTGLHSDDPDEEGRMLSIRIDDLTLASVYLPSGSSGEHRQRHKDEWLERFRGWSDQKTAGHPVIFGGDLNIAHTADDIFYAKSNEKTSGFLPHERAWMTDLLESGWHDLTRLYFGQVAGPYSWWSNRGKARELDRGWRIDYLLANAAAAERFVSADIDRESGIQVSDHAPVSITLK